MTWVQTRALFGWTISFLRGCQDGSIATEGMTANGAKPSRTPSSTTSVRYPEPTVRAGIRRHFFLGKGEADGTSLAARGVKGWLVTEPVLGPRAARTGAPRNRSIVIAPADGRCLRAVPGGGNLI